MQLYEKMDFKIILLNFNLNVLNIINQCTLTITQAHITNCIKNARK